MTIHDRNWHNRPFDVSNLLNPAFLGLVMRKIVDGYQKENENGLPFGLVFLAFPLVLHNSTRESLPRTTRTKMQPWVQENREILIQFSHRTQELVPFVRETMMFSISRQTIELRVSGQLIPGKTKIQRIKKYQSKSEEVDSILKKAEFVGKWLTTGGPPTNVFAMLGVRP